MFELYLQIYVKHIEIRKANTMHVYIYIYIYIYTHPYIHTINIPVYPHTLVDFQAAVAYAVTTNSTNYDEGHVLTHRS